MKSKIGLIAAAFLVSLISAGCYTQFATRDGSRDRDDEQSYASTDTSDTGTDSQFFGDDEYRHMRYNMSFSYYHPGRWAYNTGWGYDPYYNGIYDPWYSDSWYWPYGWRSYLLYPYPTWTAYGAYYGHHYGGYYPGSHGGGWNHDVAGTQTSTLCDQFILHRFIRFNPRR